MLLYTVERPMKDNTTQDDTKTVSIKKSQLFKQFKRAMDKPLTGLDPLELQVWDHRDEVKEHYRSKGEFYPDGGPMAVLNWKGLTEEASFTREFEWHHTKQDVINSCLEHGPKDNEEELDERSIKVNFQATNEDFLQQLWQARKEEVVLNSQFSEEEDQKIEIEWEDDTTAQEWLAKRFDFYSPNGGDE